MMRLTPLLAALFLLLAAPVASAHEVGHAPPDRVGNLRGVITEAVLPEGVTAGLYENGRAVWMRSSTPDEVIVLDDAGQPRYRLFRGTAFHNAALGEAETPDGDISRGPHHHGAPRPRASTGGPDWRAVGTELRWHSHAAHWGDPDPPAMVTADPGTPHLVRPWEISVHRPDSPQQTFALRGEIRWVPGPSPWPWLLAGLVIAGVVGTTVWRSRRPVITARVLGVTLFASLTHVLAALAARRAGPDGQWAVFRQENLSHLVCWLLTATAVIMVARSHRDGPILALFAAAGSLVLTVPDLRVLWSSTAVTDIPIAADRLAVTLVVAPALAVIPTLIRAARRSRPPASPGRPPTGTFPAGRPGRTPPPPPGPPR